MVPVAVDIQSDPLVITQPYESASDFNSSREETVDTLTPLKAKAAATIAPLSNDKVIFPI
jgi:hypothetical protein